MSLEKGEIWTQRDTHGEDDVTWHGHVTVGMKLQAKEYQGMPQTPKTRIGREGFFLRAMRWSLAMPTLWFWTSSLQELGPPPGSWYFVPVALGNACRWEERSVGWMNRGAGGAGGERVIKAISGKAEVINLREAKRRKADGKQWRAISAEGLRS